MNDASRTKEESTAGLTDQVNPFYLKFFEFSA